LQGEPRVLVLSVVLLGLFGISLLPACYPPPALAQENPYFVAYDHYLEEPGNLEIEYFSTFGTQRNGNNFHAYWAEFEYGATAWWTTELYLDGQTRSTTARFSRVPLENRFRPLRHEHWINPILYAEFENINGADKILKDVVGHDVEADRPVSTPRHARSANANLN